MCFSSKIFNINFYLNFVLYNIYNQILQRFYISIKLRHCRLNPELFNVHIPSVIIYETHQINLYKIKIRVSIKSSQALISSNFGEGLIGQTQRKIRKNPIKKQQEIEIK